MTAEPTPLPTRPSSATKDADTLSRLPTFMTVDELAALLRMNRKSVYEAINAGQIPGAHRLGRTIRITRDTVVSWLRSEARVLRSEGSKR